MSKSEIKVARRYARALFESCTPETYEAVNNVLAAISQATQDNEIKNALLNPGVKEEKRVEWLSAAIKEACPQESAKLQNLFAAVIRNRRVDIIPAMSHSFSEFFESYKRLLKLEVVSARELSQQEKESFANQVKQQLPSSLSQGVSFDWQTEADLLGGVQVKIGDKILDGSIAAAIQKIASQLNG